jgi:hypothetical protein
MKTKSEVFIYSKASTVKMMCLSFMAVAFLSSCDKSNDDVVTNQSSPKGSQKGQLNGQPITYVKKDGLNFSG